MVATAPVTVEQAATILGISASTVRRRIRAGSLRAEEARRPQGAVWLVYLPEDALSDASQASPAATPVATAPTGQTDAMATWAASLLVPIAAELGEARQTIERQAGEVADLRERVGRQGAELEQARSALGGAERALAGRERRVRAGAIIGAVLVALALVAGMLAATGAVRY